MALVLLAIQVTRVGQVALVILVQQDLLALVHHPVMQVVRLRRTGQVELELLVMQVALATLGLLVQEQRLVALVALHRRTGRERTDQTALMGLLVIQALTVQELLRVIQVVPLLRIGLAKTVLTA